MRRYYADIWNNLKKTCLLTIVIYFFYVLVRNFHVYLYAYFVYFHKIMFQNNVCFFLLFETGHITRMSI